MAGFKNYKRTIVLDFNYDQVKDGVPNVTKQMSVLNSEFKKASAEAEINGSAVDRLGVKYDFLKEKLALQEKEVEKYRKKLVDIQSAQQKKAEMLEEYRKKLEEAKKAQGDNTAEIEKYKKKIEELNTTQGNSKKAIENTNVSLAAAEARMAQTRAEIDRITKELEEQVVTLGKTSAEWNELSEKAGEVGKNMSVKVTAPILAAAAASYKLGADMEGALGKTDQVFENNSQKIKQWAKTSLDNFGLAQVTALDMASEFGGMAKGMDVANYKILEMSKSLTELTTDLAAYQNQSIEVTRTALASVFTGETESLKKFGIVMTEANLQQFAYTEGIKKKISAMTQAEKVELRYKFVMDAAKDAIGTYKREQESATAQMLLFQETTKELGTTFSEDILPMFTPIIAGVNKGMKAITELDDGTKKIIVTVAGVAAVAGPTLMVLSGFFKAISNIHDGLKLTKSAVEKVSSVGKLFSGTANTTAFFGFAKWALIIAGVAVAIGFLIKQINTLLGKGQQFNQSLSDIDEITNSVASAQQSMNRIINGTGTIPGYASGTKYHPGGLAILGEEGPELVNLPKGAQVHTASETRELLSGGDTYIFEPGSIVIDPKNVREFNDIVNLIKGVKQARRAGYAGVG